MKKHKRKMRARSDAEEGRIQAGIAADPDNPGWSAKDFRRAGGSGWQTRMDKARKKAGG